MTMDLIDQKDIGTDDVLLGRGGLTNHNMGNIRFREIIASRQMQYLAAKKKDKKAIAEQCVQQVLNKGGRFLKKDETSNAWVVAPSERATLKASQALREGLDVRNKRVRESKNNQKITADGMQPTNKRLKAATEKTVTKIGTSPSLVSQADNESGVPDLKEETAISAILHPSPPSLTKCNNVTQV